MTDKNNDVVTICGFGWRYSTSIFSRLSFQPTFQPQSKYCITVTDQQCECAPKAQHSHQAKTEAKTNISFDACFFSLIIFTFASAFARCEQAFRLRAGRVFYHDRLVRLRCREGLFVLRVRFGWGWTRWCEVTWHGRPRWNLVYNNKNNPLLIHIIHCEITIKRYSLPKAKTKQSCSRTSFARPFTFFLKF